MIVFRIRHKSFVGVERRRRRTFTPNAEIRHCIVDGLLRFRGNTANAKQTNFLPPNLLDSAR